jgi:hypothetical protein
VYTLHIMVTYYLYAVLLCEFSVYMMPSFIPTLTMINLNTVITIPYAVGTAEEQSPR